MPEPLEQTTPTPTATMEQPPPEPRPIEDEDTFLSAPPPKEIVRQARAAAPAPKPQSRPQAASPAPAQPAPQAPKISAHLIDFAEDLGFSREEAEAFGTDAALTHALRIFSKRPAQAPQPQQPQQPKDAPKPPEDDLKLWEPDARYDDWIHSLVNNQKALVAKVKELLGLKNELPQIIAQQHLAITSHQKVRQTIDEAAQGMGYQKVSDVQEKQIKALAHSLFRTYQQSGQTPPDDKTLIQAALPLVLGPSSGAPAPPRPQTVQDQQAALANRNRDESTGRFLPGAPSHRVSQSAGNGSALRTALMDKGVDPGPAPSDDEDDSSLFL